MEQFDACKEKTDEELVILALEDTERFFCLAKRYEDKLYRYVTRLIGTPKEDVEDVVQDVFVKTYQHLNAFDPRLRFSSWIYRIAHNEAVSLLRKRTTRPVLYLDEEDMHRFADTLSVEQDIDRVFDRVLLEKALRKVGEKYEEVLMLRYLEEKDYVEIADILKKPVSTVSNLISRGRKLLGEEFKKISHQETYEG